MFDVGLELGAICEKRFDIFTLDPGVDDELAVLALNKLKDNNR